LSTGNHVLVDVDLAKGTAKQVYPVEGSSAGVFAAMYSADGKRIFIATDEGAPAGTALLALDATTYAQNARFAASGAGAGTIDTIIVSPRGDRIALAFDLGHHNEIVIHDAKTLAPLRKVAAPLGAFTPGSFTADGKRFTMIGSTPDTPPDVFSVDVATFAVTPLRADARKGIGDLPALAT